MIKNGSIGYKYQCEMKEKKDILETWIITATG